MNDFEFDIITSEALQEDVPDELTLTQIMFRRVVMNIDRLHFFVYGTLQAMFFVDEGQMSNALLVVQFLSCIIMAAILLSPLYVPVFIWIIRRPEKPKQTKKERRQVHKEEGATQREVETITGNLQQKSKQD